MVFPGSIPIAFQYMWTISKEAMNIELIYNDIQTMPFESFYI